jgi:fatty acid synthase subunit beta
MAPLTEVMASGDMVYSEVVRRGVRKLGTCVEEMASGDTVSGTVGIREVQGDVLNSGLS